MNRRKILCQHLTTFLFLLAAVFCLCSAFYLPQLLDFGQQTISLRNGYTNYKESLRKEQMKKGEKREEKNKNGEPKKKKLKKQLLPPMPRRTDTGTIADVDEYKRG